MKLLSILCIAMLLTSCSLFEKAKQPAIEKISASVKTGAVKFLNCKTGEPVAEDVEEYLVKLLKVQDADQKGLVSGVCEYAVKMALPYLVNFADKKLPQSWQDDGCSLEQAGDQAEVLASKLCLMIPY